MQIRSSWVMPCSSVVKYPLFRMLRWVSVAPLGNPVVPDVYWMLIGSSGAQRIAPLGEVVVVDHLVALDQVVPLLGPEEHSMFERRHAVGDLGDHLDVVRRLELGCGDDPLAARLVQCVLEFVRPVRRVEVDEDDPDLGGRELHECPLGVVR